MGAIHSVGSRGKKIFRYYSCLYNECKRYKNINEEVIEELVIKKINEIIDFYMLADASMVAVSNKTIVTEDGTKYQEEINNLKLKKSRIMDSYYDGIIDTEEMKKLILPIDNDISLQQKELRKSTINARVDDSMDINEYATLTEIEKRKSKYYHGRTFATWNQLNREQKAMIMSDFIEYIEIEIIEHPHEKVLADRKEIILKQVELKEHKISNMAYVFKSGIVDAVVKINDKNVMVSNKMEAEEITEFINKVKEYYPIKSYEIDNTTINWNKLQIDNIIRIMPIEDTNMRYTVLTI